MKWFILLLVLSFTIPCFAVEVNEKVNPNNVTITLTFTPEEWDLFIVDKAVPKEWVRNSIAVNLNHQNRLVGEALYKELIFDTPENRTLKIQERKDKRNAKMLEEIANGNPNDIVIYE